MHFEMICSSPQVEDYIC